VEARASLSGASVSRSFIAAILIIVALGLAAMGGYLVKGVTGSGAAAATQTQSQTHAAPGTVLRQDSPAVAPAHAAPGSVLRQDSSAVAPVQAPQRPSRGHGELD
jgi:flagellar basal body-associated protein FliL